MSGKISALGLPFVLCAVSFCQTSPITIEEAVGEAIDHNLSLVAERYNISIADTRMITARLRPNPVLSVSGDHMDLLGTGFNRFNNGGPPEYAVRTDLVLERGDKRRDRIQFADAGRAAVEAQVLNTVRSVVFDVQSAFVDMVSAKENLALAQESLGALETVVRINEARVKSGDLAEVEALRSRVAALQARNTVRQAELKLRTARNRLQMLLGRARRTESFDVAGPLRRDLQVPPFETLAARAVESRPDLQALFRTQAASQAELRLQLAQSKADFTVGTEYRRQQGSAGKGNTLGVFFSAPLMVFNRNQGEIERVRRELRQTEARIRDLQNSITVEVENARDEYETARTLLETIESTMLSQARDVRRITEYSYKRGEATLIEFLDAQRAFNETAQALNEARAGYARSLYLIDSVTGARR